MTYEKAALTPQTLPAPGEVDWRDMGEAPPLTPVIAEFHEYNDPNGATREQVVWFYEGEWRSFPSTKDLAYADRWRPMPTLATVAAANDEGVAEHVVESECSYCGLVTKASLPDIEAEGERVAADTWKHPSGMYLWTDMLGAIQTAIADERARHSAIRLLSQGGGEARSEGWTDKGHEWLDAGAPLATSRSQHEGAER